MKLFKITALFACLLLVTSCISDNFTTGDSIIADRTRNVIVDTCSVNMYTVLTDSTQTSGISTLFFGRYESADLGVISADAYLAFGIPATSKSSDFTEASKVKLVVDSVRLLLRYDAFAYGDSTQVQTMQVSRLTKRLDEAHRLRNYIFYNHDKVESEATPWVTQSFKRPVHTLENDSTLRIALPVAFGEQIIDSLRAQSEYMKTEDMFYRFFKGLKLSAASTDKYNLNAFKLNTKVVPQIVVYYRSIDDVATEQTITLSANASSGFSNVVSNRSSSTLKDLVSGRDGLSSSKTGNKAFVMGTVGYSTYMTFPSLSRLNALGKYTNVVAAYLYIYPVKGSYNDFVRLPETAKLNFVNKLGDVKDVYVEGTSSLTSGVLLSEVMNPDKKYYAFDITSFVKSQIGAADADLGTLQFTLPSTSTLHSIIVGNSQYADENYRIKLAIQLSVYDN